MVPEKAKYPFAMASHDRSSTIGYLLVFAGITIAAGMGLAVAQREAAWLWALLIAAIMLWTVYGITAEAARQSEVLRQKLASSEMDAEKFQQEIKDFKAKEANLNALRYSLISKHQDAVRDAELLKNRQEELGHLSEDLARQRDSLQSEKLLLRDKATEFSNFRDAELKRLAVDLEATWEACWAEKARGLPTLANKSAEAWLATRHDEIKKTLYRAPITAFELRRKFSREIRDLKASELFYRNLVEYYESIFPGIEEFQDDIPIEESLEDSDEGDRRRKWLSCDEWTSLSETEKSQLSLERWITRNKSNWEIGVEYERWCGFRLETQGWEVTYHGAVRKFDDLGRDIIARKPKNHEVLIVQCKRWSKDKKIHEKHVFQTFGTMVAMRLDEPGQNVRGLIATTTELSSRAREFARILGVEVLENKQPNEFPRIKCNKKSKMGDVYHLPFDQKYDHIVMRRELGDFYCLTAAEAESHGFRRAMRWFG
jgi:Restriction endonuclease